MEAKAHINAMSADQVLAVVDTMIELLDNEEVTNEEACNLLHSGLEALSMDLTSSGTDRVDAWAADLMR